MQRRRHPNLAGVVVAAARGIDSRRTGEIGQVLAREQALAVLEGWSLQVTHNCRGQRIVSS